MKTLEDDENTAETLKQTFEQLEKELDAGSKENTGYHGTNYRKYTSRISCPTKCAIKNRSGYLNESSCRDKDS